MDRDYSRGLNTERLQQRYNNGFNIDLDELDDF
jgi:hypothetical protein